MLVATAAAHGGGEIRLSQTYYMVGTWRSYATRTHNRTSS